MTASGFISKDEVARDKGRPVAAVGEAPDRGGFRGEGGGSENPYLCRLFWTIIIRI